MMDGLATASSPEWQDPLDLVGATLQGSIQMKAVAAQAGHCHSELCGKDYPRVQILTIRELLDDRPEPPRLSRSCSSPRRGSRGRGGPRPIAPSPLAFPAPRGRLGRCHAASGRPPTIWDRPS